VRPGHPLDLAGWVGLPPEDAKILFEFQLKHIFVFRANKVREIGLGDVLFGNATLDNYIDEFAFKNFFDTATTDLTFGDIESMNGNIQHRNARTTEVEMNGWFGQMLYGDRHRHEQFTLDDTDSYRHAIGWDSQIYGEVCMPLYLELISLRELMQSNPSSTAAVLQSAMCLVRYHCAKDPLSAALNRLGYAKQRAHTMMAAINTLVEVNELFGTVATPLLKQGGKPDF
jgi:hypothetical protein